MDIDQALHGSLLFSARHHVFSHDGVSVRDGVSIRVLGACDDVRLRPGLRDEGGQAAVLIVGLVAVLAIIIVAIGIFGVHVSDLARARTAADAAALSGAAEGSAAAGQVAADNGGHLDLFTAVGSDVIVRVTVGTASATARATIGHAPLPTLTINGENRHSG